MNTVPVARSSLDRARKPLRLLCGALLVAFCAVSTVQGVAAWFAPVHGAMLGWGAGGLVAIVIFLVELFTGEDISLLPVYLLAFLPDWYYSYLWLDMLVGSVVRANMPTNTAALAAWIVSALLAWLAAWGGERLLFGKRRKGVGSNAIDNHYAGRSIPSDDLLSLGKHTGSAGDGRTTIKRPTA